MIRHLCLNSKAELNCFFNSALIEHRECTRQCQIDITSIAVGLIAKMARCTRKNLGVGRELHMRLKTNDDFPLHIGILFFLQTT